MLTELERTRIERWRYLVIDGNWDFMYRQRTLMLFDAIADMLHLVPRQYEVTVDSFIALLDVERFLETYRGNEQLLWTTTEYLSIVPGARQNEWLESSHNQHNYSSLIISSALSKEK